MEKQRNCSIDIFRLVFAVLVVILHSKPSCFESQPLLSLCVLSFTRFAVPFFFAVSGYFFFKGVKNGRINALNQIKKIGIIYIGWSVVYFIIKFIDWGYGSPIGFGIDCVYSFFLLGSYYHLWYLIALLFAIAVSALLCKYGMKKMLFGCSVILYSLCYVYNALQFQEGSILLTIQNINAIVIPFTQGLFYFCCGQWVVELFEKKFKCCKSKYLIFILILSLLLWFTIVLCNYFFLLKLDLIIIYGIYIVTGQVILVLLCNPMYRYSIVSLKCRYLANFIYFSHPVFRFIIDIIREKLIWFSDYWNFPITIILSVGFGMLVYKINSKYLNKFIA